jgi:Mg2+ and Co2+ transporter CorA
VWLDAGNDLSQCNNGPWLRKFPKTENTKFHPVFQHRSRMALSQVSRNISDETQGQHPQSIRHLSQNFGRHLKPEIMAQDAFYALTELFEFSAASVDQLLELCESNIKDVPYKSVAARLSELLLLKTFVDDYRSYIKDTLSIVKSRGGRNWPSVKEGTVQRDKADLTAIQLENRYRRLLERCERLQEHCASSVTILMNQHAQQQTDRAMEQTKQLKKLSVLAYFYIPVTLTASFFGMNFKELDTELSIWTFFAVSASLVVVSIIAWVIDLKAVYQLGSRLVLMLRLRSRSQKSP